MGYLHISSTDLVNILEIFNDRMVDGTYFPVSIENMVCLETFNKSPNSC